MGVYFSQNRFIVRYKQDNRWKSRSFKDEQTARAFDDEMLEANHSSGRLTLGEVVMAYLRSRPDMCARTKRQYVLLLEDGGVGAFMRDKYADMLNRQDLERFREGLRLRRVSNNTMNHYQAYIRSALAWAADQELISRNAWRSFKRLKVVRYDVNPRMDVFLKVYACLDDNLKWAFKTAFNLALRPGRVELFSLQWDAFNFNAQTVHIRQGKTGRVKIVHISNDYKNEALIRYRRDKGKGIHWVCHRDGKQIHAYHKAWDRACKQAEVQMRPYDVRHLAASVMLEAHADLAAVSAQLGHSSITTTGNTYAHVLADSQSKAACTIPVLA